MTEHKAFEEWFAVISNVEDEDEEFWPGRLSFDPNEGMALEVTSFSNFESKSMFQGKHSSESIFEQSVINGYFDYQCPTTLLKPFIQKTYGAKIGYLTPVMRSKYRVVVNGILKNVHLENVEEKIFLGIGGKSDVLHSWLAPKGVENTYDSSTKKRTIEYQEYDKKEIQLSDGYSISISHLISGPSDWDSMTLAGKTSFMLKFSKPMALYPALSLYSSLQGFLTFLIGDRLTRNSIHLPTTKTVKWNDEYKEIYAELLVSFKKNTLDTPEHPALRFFTQHQSEIPLKDIFLKWQNINKDTLYFMTLITSVEMHDKDTDIINKYTNIIGCLEKFDKNKFGGKKALVKRLERLVKPYHDDGFRGNPDLKKIKEYRNYHPHGDGASLTSDMIKEMYWFSNFLCALSRYHILKELGFSADSISSAFRRKMNVYGSFSILDSL